MVMAWPSRITLPWRVVVAGWTVIVSTLLPRPFGGSTVIHGSLGVAVHVQLPGVWMSTLTVPPVSLKLNASGRTMNERESQNTSRFAEPDAGGFVASPAKETLIVG